LVAAEAVQRSLVARDELNRLDRLADLPDASSRDQSATPSECLKLGLHDFAYEKAPGGRDAILTLLIDDNWRQWFDRIVRLIKK
jgi:hypothetical protein